MTYKSTCSAAACVCGVRRKFTRITATMYKFQRAVITGNCWVENCVDVVSGRRKSRLWNCYILITHAILPKCAIDFVNLTQSTSKCNSTVEVTLLPSPELHVITNNIWLSFINYNVFTCQMTIFLSAFCCTYTYTLRSITIAHPKF